MSGHKNLLLGIVAGALAPRPGRHGHHGHHVHHRPIHIHPPTIVHQTVVPPPPCCAPSAPVICDENSGIYSWIPTSIHNCDHLLHKAVQAGHEGHDNSHIYVGRAWHQGELIPCKVIPRHKVAYVSYNGRECPVYNIELYCMQMPVLSWVPSSNGCIPAGAVPVGHASNGEVLYTARAHHNGSLTPGKVHPSHHCCYIPFGGQEIRKPNYEVMTLAYN